MTIQSFYTNPRQFFVTFIYRFTLLHRFYHRIIINYTCGVVYNNDNNNIVKMIST